MEKKKICLAASAVLFTAAAIFAGSYIYARVGVEKEISDAPSLSSYIVSQPDKTVSTEKESSAENISDAQSSQAEEEYTSPIDFGKLKKENPDICGWVDIPDSELSFPVVQRPGDNSYYLTHTFENKQSIYGAAYMEDYNSGDFSDPVSVIYGHNINNGEWFGQFQTVFTDPEAFEKSREFKLYLPEEERDYTVFAAVPYNDLHILYYNDFSNEKVYDDFIEDIAETRALNSIVDEDALPEADQRMIIFSTCLSGDYSHRFLVLAAEQ